MEIIANSTFGLIVYITFGLLFGSFATMASYRIPHGEDLIIKSSYCPKCNHRLGFFDLFPLFSWAFNKGQCHYCKTKISIRYPLTEITMAILFAIVYLKIGANLQGFTMLALAVCLVIMIVVDLEHQIIPDLIQIALIPIGILYRYSLDSEWHEYISGVAIGLITALALRYGFFLWKKREGLGMGDVKFFAVSGLFLSLKTFAPFLLISGLIGILTSLLWKKLGKGEEFPFGPALAIALFLCVVFPEYTVDLLVR
jgi:leader peptidase (prepilin peptidase)/N-methyltransferase